MGEDFAAWFSRTCCRPSCLPLQFPGNGVLAPASQNQPDGCQPAGKTRVASALCARSTSDLYVSVFTRWSRFLCKQLAGSWGHRNINFHYLAPKQDRIVNFWNPQAEVFLYSEGKWSKIEL
jgi:hypothetical protein